MLVKGELIVFLLFFSYQWWLSHVFPSASVYPPFLFVFYFPHFPLPFPILLSSSQFPWIFPIPHSYFHFLFSIAIANSCSPILFPISTLIFFSLFLFPILIAISYSPSLFLTPTATSYYSFHLSYSPFFSTFARAFNLALKIDLAHSGCVDHTYSYK